jgi:hypothetical protein
LSNKTSYVLAAGAALAMLALLKAMYDMSGHMGRMTDSVETMAREVEQMNGRMETLVGHVAEMRLSMDRMGRVFQQGGAQLERMNPMRIMEGVAPGGGQR